MASRSGIIEGVPSEIFEEVRELRRQERQMQQQQQPKHTQPQQQLQMLQQQLQECQKIRNLAQLHMNNLDRQRLSNTPGGYGMQRMFVPGVPPAMGPYFPMGPWGANQPRGPPIYGPGMPRYSQQLQQQAQPQEHHPQPGSHGNVVKTEEMDGDDFCVIVKKEANV